MAGIVFTNAFQLSLLHYIKLQICAHKTRVWMRANRIYLTKLVGRLTLTITEAFLELGIQIYEAIPCCFCCTFPMQLPHPVMQNENKIKFCKSAENLSMNPK
jgi:hypothetical protein